MALLPVCLSLPSLTKLSEVMGFVFDWAQPFSLVLFIFHNFFEGQHETFLVPLCTCWSFSSPVSLHHWPCCAQQMAIAILLSPVKAGPGPLLSPRKRGRERVEGQKAWGWCWISHPVASGLLRPGGEEGERGQQAGGSGGWKVGAVYWCLTLRVCLCTLQSYWHFGLWWTLTARMLMKIQHLVIFQW